MRALLFSRDCVYWLLLLFLIFPSRVFADAISVEELQTIQKKFKQYDYLSVSFQQTKFVSTRPNRPIKLTGQASFAKPARFRWVVNTKSGDDVFIFDGQSLIQYRGETGTRYKSSGEQTKELSRIVELVMNFDSLLESYRPVKQERKGQKIELDLEPKVPSGDLERISVKYDMDENLLSYLKMSFKNRNSSIYEFSQPHTKPLMDSVFMPPKTVRIFDAN